MNTGKGPLADPKLREALKYAFDYDTVIEQAMMGYATKMEGPTPVQLAYHDSSLPKPTYDPVKAAQVSVGRRFSPQGHLAQDNLPAALDSREERGAYLPGEPGRTGDQARA